MDLCSQANLSITVYMWNNRPINPHANSFRKRRVLLFQFSEQWKYSLALFFTVLFTSLVIATPLFYFINHNYLFFIEMAYKNAPSLVSDLEREQFWMNGFVVIVLLSLSVLTLYFSAKMTSQFLGPIKLLKNHMDSVAKGHFEQKALNLRGEDDLKDLAESYNYLFESLKRERQMELDTLQNYLEKAGSGSSEAPELRRLVEVKKRQLGQAFTSDASAAESLDSRHAS